MIVKEQQLLNQIPVHPADPREVYVVWNGVICFAPPVKNRISGGIADDRQHSDKTDGM
jgi:hypothetical protein